MLLDLVIQTNNDKVIYNILPFRSGILSWAIQAHIGLLCHICFCIISISPR